MSAVSDILALLDRWPKWKAITGAPDRIDALEKRIGAREGAGTPKLTGGVTLPCPICGKTMKIVKVTPHHIFGDVGVQQRDFLCECGHKDGRMFDPTKE
jgi:hypothetical protein